MATAERTRSTDQRIVMHGVSWQTYERLLTDLGEQRTPQISYNQGRLELVSPSDEHERYRRSISRMIDIWTLEKRIPIRGFGSTTLKRDAKRQGAEADESYYIVNEPAMHESGGIDLTAGPPPDLAIEIDVTGNSLAKLELYAAIGVPEVWRFARQSLLVYHLDSDCNYQFAEASLNLPGFPVQQAAEWAPRAEGLDETAWAAAFQDWVRSQRSSASDQS